MQSLPGGSPRQREVLLCTSCLLAHSPHLQPAKMDLAFPTPADDEQLTPIWDIDAARNTKG